MQAGYLGSLGRRDEQRGRRRDEKAAGSWFRGQL